MANYSELIASVKLAIKQNGVKAITGQLLQDVLVSMLNSIGRYSLYAGVAIPSTNPGITDQSAFTSHQHPARMLILQDIPLRLVKSLYFTIAEVDGLWTLLRDCQAAAL